MNQLPCPHCGIAITQSRADGRCVGCGGLLSEELRPPAERQFHRNSSGNEDYLMTESVVVDENGIRHYGYKAGGIRLEWSQVREVAAEWAIMAFAPVPFVTISGDEVTLCITPVCTGFSVLLTRLSELTGISTEAFYKALHEPVYDDVKALVWRQNS